MNRSRPFFVTLCLLMLQATPAFADGAVYGGAGIANLNDLGSTGLFGVGGQLGARLALTEYWAVFSDISGSYHFSKTEEVSSTETVELGPKVVSQLAVGVRYNLDVFTYVPWAGLAATAYLDSPTGDSGDLAANAGLKLNFGVDYRFDRFWSVGGYGEIHALLTDLGGFPVYTQLGINATYHFRW